ncbi:MAG: hypothetical protein WC152_05530 [Candidatus Izemoplasmatales bacterium]
MFKIFVCFIMLLKVIEADYEKVDSFKFSDSLLVEYGIINKSENIDGYLRIYDKTTGNIKKEIVYDSGSHDMFVYFGYLSEETFVIVCNNYYINSISGIKAFKCTTLLKYDISGELLNEYVLPNKPNDYHNHNYSLFLEYDGEEIIFNHDLNIVENVLIKNENLYNFTYQYLGFARVNGVEVETIDIIYPGIYEIEIYDKDYNYFFEIIVEADCKIVGKKYSEGYTGKVQVYSYGDIYLNKEKYSIGSDIDTVGNNKLLIIGENNYRKEIDITILPDVMYYDGINRNQLIDNTQFTTSIRIYSNVQEVYLNNKSYFSELIEVPGKYEITFCGVNSYKTNIYFNILPSVYGVENDKEYNHVQLYVFGEAFLNGEKISGTNIVNEKGEYKLELLLENEVYKTINFSIVENMVDNQENNKCSYTPYLKYLFLIFVVVGGVLILRKK